MSGPVSGPVRDRDAPVCFVGPFPDPVNGQSVSTAHLWTRLAADGVPLVRFDVAGGKSSRIVALWRKLSRHLQAALWIRTHRPRSVYLSVNANAGMALTSMIAAAARRRGVPLFLHHHTRSHLEPGHARMASLCRASGPEAVHIAICGIMAAMTRAANPDVRRTLTYSNIGVVEVAADPEDAPPHAGRTLGHLSNLTVEKGVGRVIDTFRQARDAGLADRLVLAGPAVGPAERQLIAEAGAEFGAAFEWRGPVYGADKQAFFSDIDVFLFPSLYNNETQGIVNLEALSCGVPVIAFDVCCTKSDLDGPASVAIAPDADFPGEACRFLQGLGSDAPRRARAHFQTLLASYEAEYQDIRRQLLQQG